MVVGTHGDQMVTLLGPADHSRGGGTVSRGASGPLPLRKLSVVFLKALKRPLNIPKGGVPKEVRGLTLQRQKIMHILNHQMKTSNKAGDNTRLRLGPLRTG